MSHQTIVIREQDITFRIDAVTVLGTRDPVQTSTIKLPIGGAPLTFVDENDGLLLTLDSDGNIISAKGFFELTGQAAPAVSPAGKMRLYFDSGINKLLISENGGAYSGLLDGTGDVTGPASATDEALVRWDTATGKLVQDSNALLNDAGDLTLVGSQSLGKFLDVTGIAAPALSPAGEARLYFDSTSNKLRISENGGAFDDIGAGDVVGPAASTNNGIARFDGVTGKLLQDSTVTIDDAGIIKAVATGAVTHQLGNIQFGGTGSSINLIKVITGAQFRLASGAPFDFLSDENDSGTAVNFIFDGAQEMTTAGSLLLSVRNKTAGEVFTVAKDGAVVIGGATFITGLITAFQSGNHRIGTVNINNDAMTVIGGGSLRMRNNGSWQGVSDVANSAAVVGFILNTSRDLTVAGAVLLEVKNLAAIKFSVDKDGDTLIAGDLNHDGTLVGLYGTAPAAQSAAYTRDATVVEDRTLLASASATTINNNNMLAALIGDLQSRGFIG